VNSKGRVKELWKDMFEQIHEFDFALWEKDCELESLRKQLEAKPKTSTTEKTVPIGHSIGASNVTWSMASSTVDLNRVTLLQPMQQTPKVLLQHGTVHVGDVVSASSWHPGQFSTQPAREPGPSQQVPPSIVLPSVSLQTKMRIFCPQFDCLLMIVSYIL